MAFSLVRLLALLLLLLSSCLSFPFNLPLSSPFSPSSSSSSSSSFASSFPSSSSSSFPSSASPSSSPSSASSSSSPRNSKSNPPLILIPGLTASNLLVRRDHFQSRYPFCQNNSGWQLLWPIEKFDFSSLEKYLCWMESLETPFDPANNSFTDHQGVYTTTFDFGGCLGLTSAQLATPYVQQGWVLGETLFCAPYDWRFPSLAQHLYYDQLQALVEKTYARTQQKVSLLAISFGPQTTLGFLHRMTQPWKDKYIAWFVAESPVWSGAPFAVESVVSGLYFDPNATFLYRDISIRVASLSWLFPRPGTANTTWGTDDVIVRTPSKRYTAFDYTQLLRDLGLTFLVQGQALLQNEPDLSLFAAPGVDTLVTYGSQLGTPGYFEYASDFVANASAAPPAPDTIINVSETGDTLVPVRSSLRGLYSSWPQEQASVGKMLFHREYPGQQHALCCVPQGGVCFHQVVDLIVNGTVPPTDGARVLGEKEMANRVWE